MKSWLKSKVILGVLVGLLAFAVFICFQLATRGHTGILRTLVAAKHLVSRASNSIAAREGHDSERPGPQHSVTLSWKASSTAGVVYNVYRRGPSGLDKLNSAPLTGVSYVDATVQPGQTYYYVIKAASPNGRESLPSNEVRVTVPSP